MKGGEFMKANADIRAKAKESKVLLWQIADKLGVTEWTMVRKLRKELDAEQKAQIFKVIEDIAQG